MSHQTIGCNVHSPVISLSVDTEREECSTNGRQELCDNRVISIRNHQSVKREILQKLHEGLFQSLEVTAVSRHMIRINIRDNRDHRLQDEE